jgi:hypothetical protein
MKPRRYEFQRRAMRPFGPAPLHSLGALQIRGRRFPTIFTNFPIRVFL